VSLLTIAFFSLPLLLLRYVFEDSIDFVKSSVIEGTQPEDDSDQEDIDAKDILKRDLQVRVVTDQTL